MNVSEVTDKELIESAKAGQLEAFDELVRRHSGRMYQASYGLLGNSQDAEEVVQDAFIRAFKALDSFRGDASFETWLHRIVVNLSRNKYQWNKRRGAGVNISMSEQHSQLSDEKEREDMTIADESYEPDLLLAGVEFEDRIMAAFKQLPDSLREVMILRHINELSYERIAEIMECKVGTVKSRISRGRELLRKVINEPDSEVFVT